jgi:hypothetical protein
MTKLPNLQYFVLYYQLTYVKLTLRTVRELINFKLPV